MWEYANAHSGDFAWSVFFVLLFGYCLIKSIVDRVGKTIVGYKKAQYMDEPEDVVATHNQDSCPHTETHVEGSLGTFCNRCGKPV